MTDGAEGGRVAALRSAAAAVADAERLVERERDVLREVARAARSEGMSMYRIAQVTGYTEPRVARLVRD
ncbi:hypothetical protein [Leucobacter triazinivorans]|uniref:Uncharacterized protein n=1 Tax=Leucobacter triazinivorans TaxID=1784719 RepID=A0A4P6KFI8_9MICO|nr:hypothetical protein [Leucobacter triazinivorans]QBE48741.1 hypothetical protein EVS81_07780 [Leucobacter triazinivorans]